jgi:hypothetical protein
MAGGLKQRRGGSPFSENVGTVINTLTIHLAGLWGKLFQMGLLECGSVVEYLPIMLKALCLTANAPQKLKN